jgi:hypothetical protein
MAGWHHENADWVPKACVVCGTEFPPTSGRSKFCSDKCRGKWKYITGDGSTENQYLKISGSWSRYCARLLYYGGRKRDKLTKEILLRKLQEQDFKCALSGAQLTCDLSKGVVSQTNASVDRIVAGGPYTEDNIQMVCKALNYWRADTSVEDFVAWCRKVVAHNTPTLQDAQGEKENDHGQKA